MSPGPGGSLDVSSPFPTAGPPVMYPWPPTSNLPFPPVIMVSYTPSMSDYIDRRPPVASKYTDVSALGAVMAFLYSSYIVMNAVFSAVLGHVIDNDFKDHANIINALRGVAG